MLNQNAIAMNSTGHGLHVINVLTMTKIAIVDGVLDAGQTMMTDPSIEHPLSQYGRHGLGAVIYEE